MEAPDEYPGTWLSSEDIPLEGYETLKLPCIPVLPLGVFPLSLECVLHSLTGMEPFALLLTVSMKD